MGRKEGLDGFEAAEVVGEGLAQLQVGAGCCLRAWAGKGCLGSDTNATLVRGIKGGGVGGCLLVRALFAFLGGVHLTGGAIKAEEVGSQEVFELDTGDLGAQEG